jgi:aspartyl protease family protein
MVKLISLALTCVIVMIFSAQMLTSNAPGRPGNSAAAAPGSAAAKQDPARSYYTSDQTVVARENGQFYLTGQVNGSDTRFLVDTGADVVALTMEDAEQLGIEFNPGNFQPVTQTASGTGYGEVVMIEQLSVAGRELNNVQAIVIDGLGVNLLGQSALRRLGKIELHGNELVINH